MSEKYSWRSELTVEMFGTDEVVTVSTKWIESSRRYRTDIEATPIRIKGGPWYESSDEGALEVHNRLVALLQNDYELKKVIDINEILFLWPKTQEVS
ncbi:hypothetical protein D4R42_04450 [bacterium]|nr:MAG: hypothetical protein D4R42_04450 [bacterium]